MTRKCVLLTACYFCVFSNIKNVEGMEGIEMMKKVLGNPPKKEKGPKKHALTDCVLKKRSIKKQAKVKESSKLQQKRRKINASNVNLESNSMKQQGMSQVPALLSSSEYDVQEEKFERIRFLDGSIEQQLVSQEVEAIFEALKSELLGFEKEWSILWLDKSPLNKLDGLSMIYSLDDFSKLTIVKDLKKFINYFGIDVSSYCNLKELLDKVQL